MEIDGVFSFRADPYNLGGDNVWTYPADPFQFILTRRESVNGSYLRHPLLPIRIPTIVQKPKKVTFSELFRPSFI